MPPWATRPEYRLTSADDTIGFRRYTRVVPTGTRASDRTAHQFKATKPSGTTDSTPTRFSRYLGDRRPHTALIIFTRSCPQRR